MHTLINASKKKKNKNIRSKKQKRKEYLIRSDFFFSLFLVWVCCCCSSFLLLLFLVPKGPGNNINRSLGSATAPDFYLLFPFSDCSFFTQGLETAHRKTHTRHFPKVSLFFVFFLPGSLVVWGTHNFLVVTFIYEFVMPLWTFESHIVV
jgi:hypothetical protein